MSMEGTQSRPRLTDEEIKARFRVVCVCNGIRMGRLCDAIAAGARTIAEVNRTTGSGSGDCGATRCSPVIEALLRNGGCPLVRPG